MVLDCLVVIIKTYGTKMIPYYYLWQAKQSLIGANKAIEMMGGENDCQPMLLGQRDMLELEVEHFRGQSIKFTVFLLTLMVFCVSLLYLIDKGIIRV